MKYLTADFGSTFTKLVAVDTDKRAVLATANAFTTIETDIIDGFNAAVQKIEAQIGTYEYDRLLCCSSAGGGLKMVALGLVPELTAKAAKMAASSAGAKVIKTYSFEISGQEADEIYDIAPDLILLCGGTDGGNKDVIVANARRLAGINRDFSIIVAGNKSAGDEIDAILGSSGKDYVITHNVMPVLNKINIEPAKKCIKDLFIRKIIEAKGLSEVQKMAAGEVIPTPLAVMNGCELLSKGTKHNQGIGELIAVDLGGATTDVYSMAVGKPTGANVMEKGLPEPFCKRTVEGDLGMRYSLHALTDQLDLESLSIKENISVENIMGWVEHCAANPDTLARTGEESLRIEEVLARSAIEIAVKRHCGFMESTYTPMGEVCTIVGKDLTNIPYVIGIGGAIINSKNPAAILQGSKYDIKEYSHMKPKNPKFFLDTKYIFASMGLLSSVDEELALDLMKKEITRI